MATHLHQDVTTLAWVTERGPETAKRQTMKEAGPTSLPSQLAGEHWGLLPALLVALWMVLAGGEVGAAPASWFLLWASLIASYDLASRRIPNALNAATCLSGLLWALTLGGLSGLGQAALAVLAAGGLMAVFYFVGALGAGDVKALGALGAFLSPWGSLQLFVATTLCGGVLALGYLLVTRRGSVAYGGLGNLRVQAGGATLPYGLAIWAGAVLIVFSGGVR